MIKAVEMGPFDLSLKPDAPEMGHGHGQKYVLFSLRLIYDYFYVS